MIFFIPVISSLTKEVKNIAKNLIGETVIAVKPIYGSGNNRVFRIKTKSSFYALKIYPNTFQDKRDRLNAEFSSLSFLQKNGIENIPACIARDNLNGIGLYQWIEGKKIGRPTKNDIAAVGHLIYRLVSLRECAKKTNIPLASEACLSMQDIIRQTDQRLSKLIEINGILSLTNFLQKKFIPLQKRIVARAKTLYNQNDLDYKSMIQPEIRFLSPSDFGFHNTLRQKNGSLVFIDFEYFGWDDPVKLTSDFLLHPGHVLKDLQKQYFLDLVTKACRKDPTFSVRLDALFPLFGLRWCMILLSEFIPDRMERRLLAGRHTNVKAAQTNQLKKAEHMLQLVEKAENGFPYDS